MSGEAKQGTAEQQTSAIGTPLSVDVKRAQPIADGPTAPAAENYRMTRKQQAVFRVITDPAQSQATNVEKARIAGVSEKMFYLIMADPQFTELHRQHAASFVKSRVYRYLDAMDQAAAKPNRDGFNDRRMALEIAGVYQSKQQIEHTGSVVVGVVGVSMDDL